MISTAYRFVPQFKPGELARILHTWFLGRSVFEFCLIVMVGMLRIFPAYTGILLVFIGFLAQASSAQFCPTPQLPAAPPVTNCPPQSSTVAWITSLPATINYTGPLKTFCLNFSPPATNAGGITVSGATNVIIDGAGKTIYGGVSIVDSVGVELRNLVTPQSLNIPASLTSRDITIHHVRFGGLFSAGVNNPLKNFAVRDSSFICSCGQSSSDDGSTSNSCIEITSEIYGQTITPFYFERNFVESDCVKNMKVRAKAAAGGQSSVKHVIQDNYFHSVRNQLGDEVSNVTWRNSPGGVASADRNIFAKNTVISEGHATGLYLRDDMDNVNLSNNCFDIKNPLGRGVFLGGIGTASGNLDTTFSSGLQLNGNKVLISGGAALNFQAINENSIAANNPNIINNNVFATRGADSAVTVGGGSAGARWDHNTFYAGSSDAQAVVFDGSPVSDTVQFTNNIFACSRNADAGARRECLKISFDKSKYIGNNNLFFNFVASPVQVYAPSNGYQVNLSVWKGQEAEDLTSVEGNPQFVNRGNFDFHLSANSAARGIGSNGSDAGALPFSTDTLSPSAPTGLSVGN